MWGRIKSTVTTANTAIDESQLATLRGTIIKLERHINGRGFNGGNAETSFGWYWKPDQVDVFPEGKIIDNLEEE
jgi:hypothetical protein